MRPSEWKRVRLIAEMSCWSTQSDLQHGLLGMGFEESMAYTGDSLIDQRQSMSDLEEPKRPRIGYLLSRYPAISHTFFLKEVLGLRARGLAIEVASINRPDRVPEELSPIEASESQRTYYVKLNDLAGTFIRLIGIVVRHPDVAFRGLWSALQLGGWDLHRRAFALFYLAEALLVGDWMLRRSLKHLHVHFGGPVATVGMLTARAWRIPWSLTLHGPDEFFDQEAFYLRQKIHSACFVVCISDFCRSQVMRIVPGLAASRLAVVRLGVDCATLQPTSTSAALDSQVSGPLRIVCTGRLVAAKGHRILLDAIATLVRERVEVSCLLIGDGPEKKVLETQCVTQQIAGHVKFLGALKHEATLAVVAKADVFVLASFAEGLPVALMEAMALGVPCVSTTIAAIPELIQDGINGLLTPPSNVNSLADAIRLLASDAELRIKLGQEARQTVQSQYNLAVNLDGLCAMWKLRLDALWAERSAPLEVDG